MKTRFALCVFLWSLVASAFPQKAIPDFLYICDTSVELSRFEDQQTDSNKIALIHTLYKSEQLKEYYSAHGSTLIENRLDDYYLIDLNQDGKNDLIFYGWAPICNFQKLIIIAENIGNEFIVRWFKEADFVSFSMNDQQACFQILQTGCCLDKYDYLYTCRLLKGDSIIIKNAPDVFWKGVIDSACAPQFPVNTDQSDSIVIQKNAVLLSPLPRNVNPGCDSMSMKYYIKNGNRGILLAEKMDNDSTVWFFVKVKFANNDGTFGKTRIENIFGWIKGNDVEIIKRTDSGKCILDLDSVSGRQVYVGVDKLPEFPGGNDAMLNFISDNIKYPKEADVQGTVYISVIVEPNGQLSNKRVKRGIGGGCDEAALKVLDKMPVWEPGFCNGAAVPVRVVVPIKF
jgi:hypothetical protein